MNCQNCKKEIDSDSKFCEFCGNKVKIDKGYSEVIEKILNEKRNPDKERVLPTPEQLNKKMWYRGLKVLYFLGIATGIVMALGVAIDEGAPMAFVVIAFLTFLILEILKRAFYYIYLGKVFIRKSA